MRAEKFVVWSAWALFLISLLCPAVVVDMGAWNKPDAKPFPGLACTLVALPHYASNILMLFTPLVFWLLRRADRAGWPYYTLAVFFFLSGVGALLYLPMILSAHVGYVLWVASFFLAAFAALLPEPP